MSMTYRCVQSEPDCSLTEHFPPVRSENRFTCKDAIQDFFVTEERTARNKPDSWKRRSMGGELIRHHLSIYSQESYNETFDSQLA